MTTFVCENCHEIIESDNFALTCPKCGKNLIALNNRDATILKIKQYIQSAEVEHGIMSDFEDVTIFSGIKSLAALYTRLT